MEASDTWVIFVAAFGGGLFGAILQPLMAHLMGVVLSRRENRKKIEQNLRKMLYAWMDRGTAVAGLAFEIESKAEFNLPSLSSSEISERLSFGPNFPTLQLWRIKDDTLRKLAQEYLDIMGELRDICFRPESGHGKMQDLARRMTDLPREITLRMDEEHWPEIVQ